MKKTVTLYSKTELASAAGNVLMQFQTHDVNGTIPFHLNVSKAEADTFTVGGAYELTIAPVTESEET